MKRRAAFSLVEVTLALGIVAFSLMALLGLLPAGLAAVRETEEERTAANLLAAVEADVRNLPDGQTQGVLYAIPVRTTGAATSGTLFLGAVGQSVPARADADYLLEWQVRRPSATTAGEPHHLWVRIAWPGRAEVPPQWLETVISLD